MFLLDTVISDHVCHWFYVFYTPYLSLHLLNSDEPMKCLSLFYVMILLSPRSRLCFYLSLFVGLSVRRITHISYGCILMKFLEMGRLGTRCS